MSINKSAATLLTIILLLSAGFGCTEKKAPSKPTQNELSEFLQLTGLKLPPSADVLAYEKIEPDQNPPFFPAPDWFISYTVAIRVKNDDVDGVLRSISEPGALKIYTKEPLKWIREFESYKGIKNGGSGHLIASSNGIHITINEGLYDSYIYLDASTSKPHGPSDKQ